MKSFVTPAYTFTPGASGVGAVDLSGIAGFDIKRLVAIVNQTAGVPIYLTTSTTLKYTSVAGSVVTLNYDSSWMSNTDSLQVIYEDMGQALSIKSSPVVLSTEQEALMGALLETAPATDTASSGLNGRLQRIAQKLTSMLASLPASLGQKTMANSLAVTLASDQSVLNVANGTLAGTVTSAQVTVGTSAVRATVAGTAPNAARKLLLIKPSKNNSGSIFMGSSSITTANGLEIIGPDTREFLLDSGDYYLISDTAAQVVEILEKV